MVVTFTSSPVCMDARDFQFPPEPLLVYLFDPLPEPGLARVIANLEQSLHETSQPVYVVYHNPEHEHLLARSAVLRKLIEAPSYAIFLTIDLNEPA